MLHMVEAQQSQYILAQADVMAFAFAALSSLDFVEPSRSTAGQIPYGQLFEELKLRIIMAVAAHTHTHIYVNHV